MYVNTYDGYSGAGDVLTKFGMSLRDEVELTISKERFEEFIAPFMEASDDIELSSRPREGDLVFFPSDKDYLRSNLLNTRIHFIN